MARPAPEELARFGIRPEDERIHPHSPDHEWWNESYFWDWFDERGEWAGHCRFGMHPNQERAWLWLFLTNGRSDGSEWVAIEEPRLPLSSVELPELSNPLSYRGWGLEFSYRVTEPLRSGRLRVDGFGRVLSGPRGGMVLPLSVDLDFEALGAPHSRGESTVEGHSAAGYTANRYEQPATARGTLQLGSERREFEGRGERDHSWGPRPWNMEWQFLVLNGEELRLQCAVVRIPELPPIATGYLHRDATLTVSQAEFHLDFDDANVTRPMSGSVSIKAEDGSTLVGSITPLGAAEIDITHCFEPPRRSVYRRALVRLEPEDGGTPVLGWLESNRFVEPDKS